MSLVVMKRVILSTFGHPIHKRQGEEKNSQRIVHLGI